MGKDRGTYGCVARTPRNSPMRGVKKVTPPLAFAIEERHPIDTSSGVTCSRKLRRASCIVLLSGKPSTEHNQHYCRRCIAPP